MPFIDHMVKEISDNDMASVVRLQGYTMNLKNRENAVLCTIDGNEVNKSDVSVFIYDNCFNNELVDDIVEATEVLAKHLKATDSTAMTLAMDNNMTLVCFGLAEKDSIIRVVRGEEVGTTVKISFEED